MSSTSVYLTYSPPLVPYGFITSYSISVIKSYGSNDNATVLTANSSGSFLVTDLSPYTYYNISVAASTRIGSGPYDSVSIRTSQDVPFSTPKYLKATTTSSTSVNISWLPPDEDEQNGPIVKYTIVISDLSFEAPDVMFNTSYLYQSILNLEEYATYRVAAAASTAVGIGPFSTFINFTTPEDIPSAPPQNISGRALSSSVIMLFWSPPPPLDVNGIIRHYTVEAKERYTGRQWTFFAVDADLHVGSLHPYYYYDFNVSATTIGEGPYSSSLSLLTDPEPPVAAPEQLSVTMTSTSFNVTWNPPPFEDTNGPIQYYTVQVTEVDTGLQLAPRSTSDSQIIFTNLHPYYIYQFSVAAYTIGYGPYTNPINIQLEPEAPTTPPLNLSGFSQSSDSIFVSWSLPIPSGRNGIVQHYLINVTELETGNTFGHVSRRTDFTLLGLHPFYQYSITTTAVTIGPGPPTAPVIITTDQDVPTGPILNLNITVLSHEEAFITWVEPRSEDHNGIITGYIVNVTRSDTGATSQQISMTTNLYLSSLQPFTTYTSEVAAMTAVGTGPFSSSVIFLTDQTEPYSAPTISNISAVSSTTLRLLWSPPPMATVNGIITEYRINITEVNTGIEMAFTAVLTALTVQGLHPHYVYECSVSAHTVATGPYSPPSVIQMPEDIPSGFPQMFQEGLKSSQSLGFNWNILVPEDQNGMVVSYTITVYEASNGRVAATRTLPSGQLSLTVYNLLPFTNYLCSIAASTSVGTGPFSPNITVTTLQDSPDMPPRNLSSAAIDSSTVTLSWDEPDGRHNGIIVEYRINLTESETGRTFQESSVTTDYTLNNLHPDYTYIWIITAVTIAEGPYSQTSIFTTPEDAPSGPPINIMPVTLSSTSFLLNWGLPLPEEQNGEIIGYVINVTNLDTEIVQQYSIGVQSTYTVSNLKPFTIYGSIISARTAVGLGPFSELVYTTTLEDAPGSSPLNSSGVAINSTHIFLDWSPPELSTVNGVIREYRINITEGETMAFLQHTTSPNLTEAIIGPLHPFYIYHCTIFAYTIEGGPNTSVISVRTNEAAPSGPPIGLAVRATSSRSVSVTWMPPLRNQQNGILRYYLIILTSETSTTARNVSSVHQTASISGLSPYTQYNCTIQAGTIAIGPLSNISIVYTPQDVPTGPPQNISAQATNATVLVLSWAPPLSGYRNGIILRYNVMLIELDTSSTLQYTSTLSTITISNLHPHYRYSYLITAETIEGEGPYSVDRTIQMPQAAPASAPISIQVSEVSSSSFNITWSPPPREDHNGIILEYLVSLTEENTGQQFSLTSTSTNLNIESLIRPYNNYTLSVSAVTVSSGPFSSPITITTLEDAPNGFPRNLQARAVSSTEIAITWDAPQAIDSNGIIVNYTLMVVEDGNVTFITTAETRYNVNELRPFQAYTFRVAASTRVGMGPFSTNFSIMTPEAAPEGAPINLVSSSITSNSLTLTWDPPPNSLQNGIVRGYIIVAKELDTGTNRTFMIQSRTSFSVGDLHPFYTYQFNVFAVTVEVGPSSLDHQVTTLQDVPSAPPLSILEIPLDPNTLQIFWSPPALERQNGIITDYFINMSVTETTQRYQFAIPGSSLSLNVSSLHADYTYHYMIAAGTVQGIGPFSISHSIKMPEDVPSGAPLNQVGSAVNSTAIIFTWDHPAVERRNGIITGYSLILIELATNLSSQYSQSGAHIEAVIGRLHPYYDYECRIAAETAIGRGPYGQPFVTKTLQDVPSATPENVAAIAVNSTSLTVTWEQLPADQQNGIIQYYTVAVQVQQTSVTFYVNTTELMITIPNLHPAYDHNLRVSAVTVGTGPFSDPITVTTPDDIPAGPPLRVVAVSVSSTSIRISWQAPLLELQNGLITSYYITLRERETGRVLNFTTVPTDSIYVVNDLHPFYIYNCSIAAYTNGLGPMSSHVIVQTLPEEPSESPRNVSVIARNATAATIFWNPPLPEERNGIIQEYSVRITGVNTRDDFTRTINATEIVIGSLHPFYSYRVTVAAVTIAHGPFSNPLTFTMPPLAPSRAIENITVSANSPTVAIVRWLPSDSEYWNGIIRRYTIEYTLLRPARVDDYDDDGEESTNFMMMNYVTYAPTNQQPLQNNPNPTLASSPLVWEELEIDGLLENFVYSFSIFYENDAGRSASSFVVELETPSAAPSGPPTNVVVTSQSESSIVIQWNPPELFERNGAISGYLVNLTYSNRTSKIYTVSGFTFNLQIEGLPKFTEINVSVAARTVAGLGPASLPVKIKTREDVPGQPKNIKTIQVDQSTIQLSWSPPDEPNGELIEYRIVYYGYKQGDSAAPKKRQAEVVILDGPHIIVVPYSQTSLVIKDLQTGLTYTFIISGRTGPGYGANSTLTASIYDTEQAPIKSLISTSNAIIIVAAIGWALLTIAIILMVTIYIWKKKRRHSVKLKNLNRTNRGQGGIVQTNLYEVSRADTEEESPYDDINGVMSNPAVASSESGPISCQDSMDRGEPMKLDLAEKDVKEQEKDVDNKDITYL